ncbi:MAG: hypothetical protein A4E28_02575 [Methanocella sp. PtaU1.Bin125]|nr:MAG: hypothetical protein A4E28_02575 [Methanocella sp. PtaU1.Bin125]
MGYREAQFELQAGNVLLQNQFYSSAPVQRLFHSQAAAGTDTEAFAFGSGSGVGISLAQTNAGALAAADTGFYTATFSFLKFENPTATGFLHTTIGDPLASGRPPLFAGLLFPAMTKLNVAPEAGGLLAGNQTTGQATNMTASRDSITGKTGNATANETIAPDTVLKRQMASTEVGVPGRVNILAVTPAPAPRATPVPAGNATNITGTPRPTPMPSPVPPYAVLPESATLLTKPMNRQANRPLTGPMDPDYNPRKATRDQVANISGWDRFTTNVIGRSGIDSTYMNRTAYPGYINPWNVIRLADQYKVMSDSANMTKAGSWLNPRMWAL